MSRLWNWINKKEIAMQKKMTLFLLLNCLIYSVAGFLIWFIVSRFALEATRWAMCFIGYSGFFGGFLGGYLFLCRR